MHIDPKGTLFGYPALDIRQLLRRLSGWPGGVSFVAEVMEISEREAAQLAGSLVAAGYLGPGKIVPPDEETWSPTLSGCALALSSAAKPLRRATAMSRLSEFLDRVELVNEEPYWLYRVRKVVLFGSMLTDSPTVNDVDLAVDLVPKSLDPDEHRRRSHERITEARRRGRHFSNCGQELSWPEDEIYLFLRARTRTLSICEYKSQAPLFSSVPHEVLFEHADGLE